MLFFGKVGHARKTGRAGGEAKSARAFGEHVGELLAPGDDVGEVVAKVETAQDVGIGQAHVGVEEDDPLARTGQGRRRG